MCHDYNGPTTFAEKPVPPFSPPVQPASENRDSADDGDSSMSLLSDYSDSIFESVTLDLKIPNYDFKAASHIIACFGEYNSDRGSKEPLLADPKNKYSHQEFMLLRRVEKFAGNIYNRVGVASSEPSKLMKMTKAEGWTRKKIILV